MFIESVESERLIIRRRVGADAIGLPPFWVFARREPGKELGAASLEPTGEPGSWSLRVWMAEGTDCATETIAALTRVALEMLRAKRVEVIVFADDEAGKGTLETLGFHATDRARTSDDKIMERWVATTPAAALRIVPHLRVMHSARDATVAAPLVWGPEAARTVMSTVMSDALANYED